MSSDKPYTASDDAQFAALMPKGGGSAPAPAGRISDTVPAIRTRESYTDADLEKFQKMFSDGFAPKAEEIPAPRPRPAAKPAPAPAAKLSPPQPTDDPRYNSADDAQFQRLLPGSVPKATSKTPGKGGRIAPASTSAQVPYSDSDLEQFDGLAARTQAKPARGSATAETDTPRAERRWRFPDLLDAQKSILSDDYRGPSDGAGTRAGSRVKLRYFD